MVKTHSGVGLPQFFLDLAAWLCEMIASAMAWALVQLSGSEL